MVDQYARSLAALAHFQVGRIEEVIEMVENGSIDPAAARTAIDGRKWVASKMLPKVYGDKVINELVGADGGAVKVEQVNPLEVIEARLAKLIAARPDETK